MSIYPQLGRGSLGTTGGVADRITDLERLVGGLGSSGSGVGEGSLGGDRLVPGSITASHIAANSITTAHLTAGSITAELISAGAINAGHIQANVITAAHIAAGTITATQIAAGTITGGLIQAGTITATNIAAGTLTGQLIAAGTITGDRLVAETITATQIVGTTLSGIFADLGTVTAGTLRIGVIDGTKTAIGDSISTSTGTKQGIVGTDAGNGITFWLDSATGNLELKGTIKSGSTGLGNISGAIDGTANITQGTVAGDRLVANSITAGQIDAGSVRTAVLVANSITAGMIQAGQIETAKLAAGAVTADKITVAVGGGNLARNGHLPVNAAYYTTVGDGYFLNSGPTVSRSVDDFYIAPASLRVDHPANISNYVGWRSIDQGNQLYRAGKKYIFSFYARLGAGSIGMEMFFGFPSTDSAFKEIQITAVAGSEWNRYFVTWVPTTTGSNPLFGCRWTGGTRPDGWTLYYSGIQVEEGDVLTAYSPDRSISATEILPGSITTGSLSADAIDGKTITGALIRTAASGARVELSGVAPIGLKKYDADGNVTVKIGQADGLDLLASTVQTPPTDRRLRWLQNGVSVFELYGSRYNGAEHGRLRVVKGAGTNPAHLAMEQVYADGTTAGELGISTYATVGTGFVRVVIEGRNKKILGGDGTSDFQLSASDARDKHSIVPLDAGALGRVLALRPVEYDWNENEGPKGRQTGLLAQDVAEVIPSAVQAVGYGTEEHFTIQHAPLIAALIGAVQELEQRLKALE